MMRNTEGSSIVSVMAAFLVLLLGIAMLFSAVRTAQRASDGAERLVEQSDAAVNAYYLDDTTPEGGEVLLEDGEKQISIPGDLKKGNGEFWLYYFRHR